MPQQKSTLESTRVRIPSLKFTIKSGCKALSEGPKRLWDFSSTHRFKVKFVRIDPKTRPGEMHMGYFTPGADYKFKEGDVCWILPHLPSPVKRCGEKDTDFTQKLVREFGNSQIFTVGKSNAICVKPKTPGTDLKTDLKRFMAEFDLQDEDLKLDKLPVVAFKYTRYCPASPCTVPCAEKLLLELLKFEEDPDKLANLGELLALNLRRNFSISPVAVVNCHSDEEDWEIPERTTTLLTKGDWLVFLECHHEEVQKIKESMRNLNESDFEVEEHSIFHDAGPDGCHKALVVEVRKVLTLAPRNSKRKIRRAQKKSRGRLETLIRWLLG